VPTSLEATWRQVHPSVCSITHGVDGQRIGSGTGFRVGKYIVTNQHVLPKLPCNEVTVTFVSADGHTPAGLKAFTALEFMGLVVASDDEARWDYAVLDAEGAGFGHVSPLQLGDHEPDIGAPIAVVGVHFEQQNLAIHGGFVASKFEKSSVEYLQLDASINHGNSGGPLISIDNGRVVGIVTRKATGLTEMFDQLLVSFDVNERALAATSGLLSFGSAGGSVDPAAALRVGQTQMRAIAVELRRSANVGIGFAYSLREVRGTLARLPP
jgi:S1-C subfamily serine protease